MNEIEQKALNALKVVIPFLEKYNFRWVITGGFACYVYGVKRPIMDIDIDIETSKDSSDFKSLIGDLRDYVTESPEHFVDQNYDNYNFEITINGVVVDVCPMTEMKIFDKATTTYINFYKAGFPEHEIREWNGFKLPLLSKELIIKNKEILVLQRESDVKDIQELKALL